MKPAQQTTDAIYGGADPRDLPRYSYSEASRATGVPASTIAAWVRGQDYTLRHGGKAFFRPVIERPGEGRLSFYNLIEVHVLRSLRTKHAVQLQHVREAPEIAEAKFNLPKLLLSDQLRFGAGDLFLAQYGRMVQLSRAEQLVLQSLLITHLDRIEFGSGGLPLDFSPLERITLTGRKLLLVSPVISFGRPIVRRLGVTTRAIAERINLGESAEDVRSDYGLQPDELSEALAYESAA
ncbi:hypothetical protein BH09GEM1_BH09GEM1_34110 [soil metagenome]